MNDPDLYSADDYINKLGLTKHPEGGYFNEVYRSDEDIPPDGLPERYDGTRSHMTSIYFLLKSGQVSRFHRLRSDETWYFHAGSPITVHIIKPDATYAKIVLGKDFLFQATVPRDSWFGATVDEEDSFSLISCAVSPGFDFDDFEIAPEKDLLSKFPQNTDIIRRLT